MGDPKQTITYHLGDHVCRNLTEWDIYVNTLCTFLHGDNILLDSGKFSLCENVFKLICAPSKSPHINSNPLSTYTIEVAHLA